VRTQKRRKEGDKTNTRRRRRVRMRSLVDYLT
jgi:hypothetical protein